MEDITNSETDKPVCLVLKYVDIWSSIIFNYNQYSKLTNGSYFSLSEDHFPNMLKTHNPFLYQLYVSGLSAIAEKSLEKVSSAL